jgi:hypothetical protein
MRKPLFVFSVATCFGLVLAIAINPEPGGKLAAGLTRGAIAGVILASNAGAPAPVYTQARLLLWQSDGAPERLLSGETASDDGG